MLDLTQLDGWLEALAAVDGVESAVLDPAQLRTPGVWCRIPSFGVPVLAADHYRLDVELYLAVADLDWRRSRDALAELFTAVHTHLEQPRVDVARFLTLAVPNGGNLPALLLPHTLLLTP